MNEQNPNSEYRIVSPQRVDLFDGTKYRGECAACKMKPSHQQGWYGVDLDGTLARYDGWKGVNHIGEPIPAMVERVKQWLAEGREVRIVTARVAPRGSEGETQAARAAIATWCVTHLGRQLEVTHCKDMRMLVLYDDRCVQIEHNTGRILNAKEE